MEPGKAHKLGALALALLLIGLQLRAMLGPFEDWPFTSAPMFAFRHSADQPLYEIAVVEVLADGSERRLRAADLGLRELSFGRFFFAEIYGSTDPRHPAGHHLGDTPAAFSARMSDFSERVVRIRARRSGTSPAALRYELVRILPGAPATTTPIGRFDVAERRFAQGS